MWLSLHEGSKTYASHIQEVTNFCAGTVVGAEGRKSGTLRMSQNREQEAERKRNKSGDNPSPPAYAGFASLDSFNNNPGLHGNTPYKQQTQNSDSEESLYDKYGHHRGYTMRRRQEFRSKSTERKFSNSPKVSNNYFLWISLSFTRRCTLEYWTVHACQCHLRKP